ncbi:glycosyltransferase family 2 protein [Serinicoccus sp. LYQ131]|uniref:glycosyltransferase family 2 protein n=1 Tax=Serinicoccus sp. LYQ131 TaxID=3378797 RepID=UPI0038519F2D
MNEAATVSVVIPAYNAAKLLGGAISSALTQTRTPDEVIVVDDGSTDATAAIAAAYPAPVRLISQANGGVADARNTAVREARGDFIVLLDADDQFLPNHLERCIATWQSMATSGQNERLIVTSNAYRLTRQGLTTSTILSSNFPPPALQRQKILETNFAGIFAFYPRHLHDEVGLFDATMRRGEDRDLWIRAIFSGWRIVPQREAHAVYRMAGTSLSADHERMAEAERQVLQQTRDRFADTLTATELAYLDLRLSSPAPRQLIHEANDLIRRDSWLDAADRLRQAAQMLPSDGRVRARAWLATHRWARPLLSIHLRMSDTRLRPVSE